MLVDLKSFKGYGIDALDGFAGSVHEFIFNKESKKVHGIVINSGIFLMPDLHIVNPEAVYKLDLTERRLSVNLTKKEILFSPIVSVLKKNKIFMPVIWGGTYFSYGWYQAPLFFYYVNKSASDDNSSLRNTRELKYCSVQTLEPSKGRFDDFICIVDS